MSHLGLKLPIYLDNHATTPMDPRVLDAMLPYFTGKFGNAASRSHPFGWEADAAVETAREQIAHLIGASAPEIVFTSGATESDNLALKGATEINERKERHVITVATEHKAVLDTCKRLEEHGCSVTYLPVESDGRLDLNRLENAITSQTVLMSVMAANNEIGTLQPMKEIGEICRRHGILFHSDAVQALGKVPLDVEAMNLDLVSLTAHKVYGPKGCGALYVRKANPTVRLSAILDGGGHEQGMRSGTLNVPGIVGFGKACEIAQKEMENDRRRTGALRDRLKERITGQLSHLLINGSMDHRLPGNLNISFRYVDGEALLTGLSDVAVSSGSACTSDKLEPSYVLKALGLSDEDANSSIRFGIGRFNSEEEMDYTADRVTEIVTKLRELSPTFEAVQESVEGIR
ncbi:MAG TPA: IscS subfamily cysteine desulfurase [Candidatus Angelobacter sp.]|nr:IscS subfamily cysteine desulfurase [Candidatus Angelobacter sp.]